MAYNPWLSALVATDIILKWLAPEDKVLKTALKFRVIANFIRDPFMMCSQQNVKKILYWLNSFLQNYPTQVTQEA